MPVRTTFKRRRQQQQQRSGAEAAHQPPVPIAQPGRPFGLVPAHQRSSSQPAFGMLSIPPQTDDQREASRHQQMMQYRQMFGRFGGGDAPQPASAVTPGAKYPPFGFGAFAMPNVGGLPEARPNFEPVVSQPSRWGVPAPGEPYAGPEVVPGFETDEFLASPRFGQPPLEESVVSPRVQHLLQSPTQGRPLGAPFGQGYGLLDRIRGGTAAREGRFGMARGGGLRGFAAGFGQASPEELAQLQAIRQAQQTTPAFAMGMNVSPTAATPTGFAQDPYADIRAREQQILGGATAEQPGMFRQLGNTPPALQGPGLRDRLDGEGFGTKVTPGVFGSAPRLTGAPRSAEERAAHFAEQERVNRPIIDRLEKAEKRIKENREKKFLEMSPQRHQYLQQRYGRSFGMPPAGSEDYWRWREAGGKLLPKGEGGRGGLPAPPVITDPEGNNPQFARVGTPGFEQWIGNVVENLRQERLTPDQFRDTLGTLENPYTLADLRQYATSISPGALEPFEAGWYRLTPEGRRAWQQRHDQYETLRQIDPELPEWQEPAWNLLQYLPGFNPADEINPRFLP